jgi:K+-transporting ATPase ATPase A chain
MLTDSCGFILIFLFTLALALPLGSYMKRIYNNEKTFLDFLLPVERWLLKIIRVNPDIGMNWKQYLLALLGIQLLWVVPAFALLMVQNRLFLNPARVNGMEWSLALNTAISFLTSTNLQHYAGENGVSYFSQIGILTYLQFVSAATSLCAGVAIVRALSTDAGSNVGNFFNDLLRSCTRILLPLSLVAGIMFIAGGMPMNFDGPDKIVTLQGDTTHIARGPVAVMVPIKELGSNGGGFYGANDAHPFENPNFKTFILHFIIVLLLPMAFVFFIGDYLGRRKFSWMLFGVMTAGLALFAIPIARDEAHGNPKLTAMGINNANGNMEGKEVRFGADYSAFYAAENIAIPAGTVASVHDSYMPLSSVAMLIGMQIDAFFGGLGTGWINMFIYLIIAVFIATLMIGRSPELFGRKISIKEMRIATFVSVAQIFVPISLAAVACFVYVHKAGGGTTLGWLSNKGPHGFTTMLYEYISAVAGNGSDFGGLGNNTCFWNLSTGLAMLAGRFIPIIGGLMIAGLVRQKQYTPASMGTLQTDSATFGVFLFAMIIILSALSLFIVLMAGPIYEHFMF